MQLGNKKACFQEALLRKIQQDSVVDSHLGNKAENTENGLLCLLLRIPACTGREMTGKMEKEKEIHFIIMESFRYEQHTKLAIFYSQLKMEL